MGSPCFAAKGSDTDNSVQWAVAPPAVCEQFSNPLEPKLSLGDLFAGAGVQVWIIYNQKA